MNHQMSNGPEQVCALPVVPTVPDDYFGTENVTA